MLTFIFVLWAIISPSVSFPRNKNNEPENITKCIFCNYFYDSKDTPYKVLRDLSIVASDISPTRRDNLLINEDDINKAEFTFINYCKLQCPIKQTEIVSYRGSFGLNGEAGQLGEDPESTQNQPHRVSDGFQSQSLQNPENEYQNRDAINTNSYQQPQTELITNQKDTDGGNTELSNEKDKGEAVVSGSGASLTGSSLSQGDVSGSVITEEKGNVIITAEIQDGGYLSGAAANSDGSASATSDVKQNEESKSLVGVSNGGSAIGLTGTYGSASGIVLSNKENGTSYSSVTTKTGSTGGAASSSGLGSLASSSGTSNHTIALQGSAQEISSTGVSSAGEASGAASSDSKTTAVSAASTGGSSSVGAVSGQAAASNTVKNDSVTSMVYSKNGTAGSTFVSGMAAGGSSSSNDSLASSVSSTSGMASGTSVNGQGSASVEANNKTVTTSVSTQGGMASGVSTNGQGAASSSGSLKSGITTGVSNEFGTSSSSAKGEGAVVASSVGKTTKISLISSKKKGATASATSSRFLPLQPSIKSRKVTILRRHCDEEFCKRYSSELCCEEK